MNVQFMKRKTIIWAKVKVQPLPLERAGTVNNYPELTRVGTHWHTHSKESDGKRALCQLRLSEKKKLTASQTSQHFIIFILWTTMFSSPLWDAILIYSISNVQMLLKKNP